jgi:hypothetical protein
VKTYNFSNATLLLGWDRMLKSDRLSREKSRRKKAPFGAFGLVC